MSPSEHLRMLIELLQPNGPDLARRWVSALMLVPRAEREGVVARVERRLVEAYGVGGAAEERGAEPGAVQPGPGERAVHERTSPAKRGRGRRGERAT